MFLYHCMKRLFTYRAYGADTFAILNDSNLQLLCKFGHHTLISHPQSSFSTVWDHCFDMVPKDSSSSFNSCCSMHFLCLEAHFANIFNGIMQNESSYICLLQECLLSLYPAIINTIITSLSSKCWLVKSSSSKTLT